jgi:ethanolamine phosphate phosphodiesterase
MTIFEPDVVIILGDVFDEGNWVDDKSYDEYVKRFYSIFFVPSSTRLYAIHGNHDVNFHYAMHPHLIRRFDKAFNTSGVRLIREKKTTSDGTVRAFNFVTVNSMALERDGCKFCYEAETKLREIEKKLQQLKQGNKFTKPIMLQHFPTYRPSDEQCLDKDSVNLDKYREKWDTLSKEASEFIQQTINPVSLRSHEISSKSF